MGSKNLIYRFLMIIPTLLFWMGFYVVYLRGNRMDADETLAAGAASIGALVGSLILAVKRKNDLTWWAAAIINSTPLAALGTIMLTRR
ncbi:MAG: hypothetical protein ABR530_10265 [Pyrinomonadaceae bacterium]